MDIVTNPYKTGLAGLNIKKDNKVFDFTPSWIATAGATPTIGNGTMTGWYSFQGDMIICTIAMTMGAGTTYGGAGTWGWFLPLGGQPARAAAGSCVMIHTGVAVHTGTAFVTPNNTLIEVACDNGSTATFNQPFAWAATDQLIITITYPQR